MQVAVLDVLGEEGALHLLPPPPAVVKADLQLLQPSAKVVKRCVEMLAGGELRKPLDAPAPLIGWAVQIVQRYLIAGSIAFLPAQ